MTAGNTHVAARLIFMAGLLNNYPHPSIIMSRLTLKASIFRPIVTLGKTKTPFAHRIRDETIR